YGTQVHTCVPFDPESKGGTDSTVRLAKADVVPTQANLRAEYDSIAELEAACEAFCAKVNGRSIASQRGFRPRRWSRSGSGCMCCRPHRTPSRWARPEW